MLMLPFSKWYPQLLYVQLKIYEKETNPKKLMVTYKGIYPGLIHSFNK